MNISTLLIFQNLQLSENALRIAECAGHIMNRYSEVQSSIVYQNIGKLADLILGNEMANTTRIINTEIPLMYSKNELEPYYMLTVIIRNTSELEKYFDSVYRIIGWNSRAKHFIIYLGNEDVLKVFQLSWDKFIIRLVIMDSKQDLYTYYPLENCGNVLRKYFLFNCKAIDFNKLDSIFSKIYTNMGGCKIKVLTFPISPYVMNITDENNPGFEIKTLRELSIRLNFTIQYIPHNNSYWGIKTLDNNYTEMYDDFYKKRGNIMMGMLVANGSFLYDFDSSIAYTASDLAFFVPAAQKAHPWENPILIFTKRIWCIILGTTIVTSIFWFWIGNMKKQNEGFDSFIKCVLHVIGIILGESLIQPRTHTFRYVFIIWTLYSLILTSTFESSLMSFLTKPAFEKDVDTLAQLTASQLKIGGVEYAKELFVENEDVNNKMIYQNWIDCDLNAFCVNRTADKRDFAAMNDVRQVNYLSKDRYLDYEGKSKIHQMPVSSSSYIWILMLKGFPLKQSLDKLVQRFVEFGLMEKWLKEVSYTIKTSDSVKHVAINVDHIMLALLFLGSGFLIAFLCFIAEVAYYKVVKTHTE